MSGLVSEKELESAIERVLELPEGLGVSALFATRSAEALRGGPPWTRQGELVPTLERLAAESSPKPSLVSALTGKTPMVITVHKPVPGWAGSFTVKDFMDATLDPVLAEAL